MKQNEKIRKIWKGILWLGGMIILFILANIWYKIMDFNSQEELVSPSENDRTVYYKSPRNFEIIDSWETTILETDGEKVYKGATFSNAIVNENDFDIEDWELRLDISQECYLNSFWCGSFEVHQYREGTERTYLIESQYSDISDSGIDHNMNSDSMLIHLLPGDYLFYLPSEDTNEITVKSKSSIGFGFIFYYQNEMDLSGWTVSYKNKLRMTEVASFKLALGFMIVWIAAAIIYFAIVVMSNKMKKEMESRIRNFSIMADLYIEAYVIDIIDDTAQLIKGADNRRSWDLCGSNVQKTLNERIECNCINNFKENLLEFLDLSTVEKRFENASSISVEYIDENIGWCSLRLFRAGGDKKVSQVVFTVQDINEEKKQLREIEDRMNLVEYKQSVSGSFMENVSFVLNELSSKINDDGRAIMDFSSEEEIEKLADRIVKNTRHMQLIRNTMFDLYASECQKLTLNNHPYNIYEMIDELRKLIDPYVADKSYELIFEIDKDIPDSMIGDRDRIEQILVILLLSSILMTEKGFVKFSVYGKKYDNEEELIFSIRDSAMGFTEAQIKEIGDFINGSSIETFDNASLVYLKIINSILDGMSSKLNIVSVLNEGSDFYFTLRQSLR